LFYALFLMPLTSLHHFRIYSFSFLIYLSLVD
jgi:hypothetical protein